MTSRAEVEEEVFRVIRTFKPEGSTIERDQKLIAGLKLLSDDATAIAIRLERKFKVKIPLNEWGNVSTVQDMINLLVRHTVNNP